MYIVCHMLTSLDGKIDGEFFSAPETMPAAKAYGDLRGFYGCQATVYGTTTMEGGFADGRAPLVTSVPDHVDRPVREDYINKDGAITGNYIISVDPKGSLGWNSNVISKKGRAPAHVIEALTEQVPLAYENYLREKDISYIFAGRNRLDCSLLVNKLEKNFGITRIMVAGGGIANQSFLQEGLIDELSIVIAPVADGSRTAASIFERADFLPDSNPFPLHWSGPIFLMATACGFDTCRRMEKRNEKIVIIVMLIFMLYTLGLRDYKELDEMIQQFINEENVVTPSTKGSYSYEDIMGVTFKLVNASDRYQYDSQYQLWTDKSDDEKYMEELVAAGEDIKIVGVVQPSEDANGLLLSTGIAYPASLTKHVAEEAEKSDPVTALRNE